MRALTAANILSLAAILIFYARSRFLAPTAACAMTWSRPNYNALAVEGGSAEKARGYALYRVTDGASTRSGACVPGLSLLFVPGTKGSHEQARSLASVLAAEEGAHAACVDVFALSFGGEDALLLGGAALSRQARWVATAAMAVARGASEKAPPRLLLVGHSLGGVAARAAAAPLLDALPRLPGGGALVGVLTLATPHLRAPAAFDGASARFFGALGELWRRGGAPAPPPPLPLPPPLGGEPPAGPALWALPLISITGGAADGQVVEAEADVRALAPRAGAPPPPPWLWLSTRAPEAGCGAPGGPPPLQLQGAYAGVEHQAMVWCKEVLRAVAGGVRAGELAARRAAPANASAAWAAAFAAAAGAPLPAKGAPPPLRALLRNAAAAFPLRYGTATLSLALLLAGGALSRALQGGGGGGGGVGEDAFALLTGPYAAARALLGGALARCGAAAAAAPLLLRLAPPPSALAAWARPAAAPLLAALALRGGGFPTGDGGAPLPPLLAAAAARLALPAAAAEAVEWAAVALLAAALVALLRGCCGGARRPAAAALAALGLLSLPTWAARVGAWWWGGGGGATPRAELGCSLAAAALVALAALTRRGGAAPPPPLPPLPPPLQQQKGSAAGASAPPPPPPPRCLCAGAGKGGGPPNGGRCAEAEEKRGGDCWASLPSRLVARLSAADGGAAAPPQDAAAAFADLQRRAARWSRVRLRSGAVLVALPDSAQLPAAVFAGGGGGGGAASAPASSAPAPRARWLPSLEELLQLPACALLHFLCPSCACPHAGGHPVAARFFAARAAARLLIEGPRAAEARTWGDVAAWEVAESEAACAGEGEGAPEEPGALQLAAALLLGAAALRAVAGRGGLNDAGAFVL
jgi:hypothetical protein